MKRNLTKRLLVLLLVFCMLVPQSALAAGTYYLEVSIREEANPAKIVSSDSAGYLLESEKLAPLVVAAINERYQDGSLAKVFASPAMQDIMNSGLVAYEKKDQDNGTAWKAYTDKFYSEVTNLDDELDLKGLCTDLDSNIGQLTVDAAYQMKFKNEVVGDPKYGTTYIVTVVRRAYTAGHDCPSESFADVDTSLWYHEAIDYAIANGIMNGVGGNQFNPDAKLTRAMLMTMLARLDGVDTTSGATWYEKGMEWAVANGISDGTAPEANITREQIAAMLYRYAQYKGCDVSVGEDANILSYEDASEVSEWAISAIQWACGAGVMQGGGDGYLNPQADATRAQVAQFFMNFCVKVLA